MSSNKKNLLVGAMVLIALILLGWMILRFGGKAAQPFAAAQLPVEFITDRADGLFEGSAVYYRGVNVGQVTRIRRSEDQVHVLMDAVLDPRPPLPANVLGKIRSQGIISSGTIISLELTGPKPEGQLASGTKISASYAGSELLPKEFSELARELTETSRQFRETNLPRHLDEVVQNIQRQVAKTGEVLDSIQGLVSDAKIRQDIQAAIANIRTASDTATRVGENLERFSADLDKLAGQAHRTLSKTEGHVDTLAKQLDQRLGQIASLLNVFQKVAGKIEKGQGTAGLLVNDPRLYQNMVDATKALNLTISDLQRLVEQWEQEGITFRLNK